MDFKIAFALVKEFVRVYRYRSVEEIHSYLENFTIIAHSSATQASQTMEISSQPWVLPMFQGENPANAAVLSMKRRPASMNNISCPPKRRKLTRRTTQVPCTLFLPPDIAEPLICITQICISSEQNTPKSQFSANFGPKDPLRSNSLVTEGQVVLLFLKSRLDNEGNFDEELQLGFQVLVDFIKLCQSIEDIKVLETQVVNAILQFFERIMKQKLSIGPDNAFWQAVALLTTCSPVALATWQIALAKLQGIMAQFEQQDESRKLLPPSLLNAYEEYHYLLHLLLKCLESFRQSRPIELQSVSQHSLQLFRLMLSQTVPDHPLMLFAVLYLENEFKSFCLLNP